MKKVSVLMSIYNENKDEVDQSLNSLLQQTYKNIEIIIVIDNPNEKIKYKRILEPYLNENKNIIVLYNDLNLGLAVSMNKAFNVSTGEYLARMDADDISFKVRIEKEVKIIEKYDYDLVCTGYEYIDENENKLPGKYFAYDPKMLSSTLITTNCIHHPTVLMKRIVFENVGGYRDFPCSQDYDLWLRLLENNCKFYMIDEPLLQYRIRDGSTTNRKRFIQACTLFYISKLFYQRIQFKKDNYSKEKYNDFMKMCNKKYKFYKKNIIYFQNIQKKLGRNIFVDICFRVYLLLISNFIRDNYLLKYKIKKKMLYSDTKNI